MNVISQNTANANPLNDAEIRAHVEDAFCYVDEIPEMPDLDGPAVDIDEVESDLFSLLDSLENATYSAKFALEKIYEAKGFWQILNDAIADLKSEKTIANFERLYIALSNLSASNRSIHASKAMELQEIGFAVSDENCEMNKPYEFFKQLSEHITGRMGNSLDNIMLWQVRLPNRLIVQREGKYEDVFGPDSHLLDEDLNFIEDGNTPAPNSKVDFIEVTHADEAYLEKPSSSL